MTSKDNIIYYTITAVVFIGVVLISLLFHNRGQPINGDSDKGFMTENIIAISPFVTAAATVVLGLITWRYVRLTREILKATNKPEILIFLHPADRFPSINLCIQNIGTGFASKIMFTGDLAFRPTTLHSIPLKDIGIFKNGIDYLGPEKKLEIPLFYTHSMDGLPEQQINITVTYKDSVNTGYKESFSLEFKQWEGYRNFERDSLNKIVDKLSDIERTLRSGF